MAPGPVSNSHSPCRRVTALPPTCASRSSTSPCRPPLTPSRSSQAARAAPSPAMPAPITTSRFTSDRAAERRAVAGGVLAAPVGVEAHREVADEELADRLDHDALAADRHQPLARLGREPL